MDKLLLGGFVVLVCIGCDTTNSSDPLAAKKAADAAPKSAADLPSTMPPEAKASAIAAIGQAKAQEQQNGSEARVKAFKMMQQQGSH